MADDQYRNRFQVARSFRVTVTLVCGCRVKTRNIPMNWATKYSCPSNLGHGYSLVWTEFKDDETGFGGKNPQ